MAYRPLFVLLGALLIAAAPRYDRNKLPYQATWGAYTVKVESVPGRPRPTQKLTITDRQGRVAKEIRAVLITNVSFPKLLRGDGADLHVAAFSGGAHSDFADYLFTQKGGLRNILVFFGRNDGIGQIKDLNGDGIPELIAGNDALAYFDDLPFALSPHLTMVLGWNGQRYVDVTSQYPAIARENARRYRQQLGRGGDIDSQKVRAAALGYYANATLAGEGPSARSWIRGHESPETFRWLEAHEAAMRKAIAASRTKISVSQSPVLTLLGVRQL
jgi:hypothetical protein